jgi:DNA phosphorothioation-dependent restriction protein DptH
MNLFVETLSDYIKAQWDQALNDTGGTKEALLIVQSLDPDTTFDLFRRLILTASIGRSVLPSTVSFV